jgi:hypothetical protein
LPDIGLPKSNELVEFERTFTEKWCVAERQAREELGELYDLVEMGDEATVDRLMKDLEVQEQLDGMIDRCIKRLLMVRGLKSMMIGSASTSPKGPPDATGAA